jgi:pimeloyl-ACP methyl ester carboxylesterase
MRPVVFVHGMYMTPLCWENWLAYFKVKGWPCSAPAWPGRERSVQSLRQAHPDPELGKLTLSAVVDHYARLLEAMPEKPILIGHSMGGLVVQLLLQRGLAAGGIAIDSAPPQGVFSPKWSFLKANFPHINPFKNQSQPILMTFERFQYAFVNGMDTKDQRAAYERYVVPESRRVPRESLGRTARIDFQKLHAPLLFIAGSQDNIIPPSLNRANFKRYALNSSITDIQVFPGRNHFIIGQSSWEEIAGFILTWLKKYVQ